MFEIFDSNDLRKDVTVARGFTDDSGEFIPISSGVGAQSFTKKYMTSYSLANDSPANWKVIRYADVLLMLAEAMNENGNTNEAHEYLNMLRSRAGVEKYSDLSQIEFRDKVYLERRLELSFEGHRRFDLIRTGRAIDVLAPMGMQPHMILFPIPQTEVDVINNPDILPQNPGY